MSNNISDGDLHELLKIKTLQIMNLSYNNIHDAGAALLASYANLIELKIGNNKIGNVGMSALITSSSLLYLFAEHNLVDASISEVVLANFRLKNIQLRNQSIDRVLQHCFNKHTGSNCSDRKKSSHLGFLPPIKEEGREVSDRKKENKGGGCIIS